MVVNKITFADLAGVDKSAVTLSVQRGKLIQTKDGYIDTDDPVNAAYLAKRRAKQAPAEQDKPLKKPAKPRAKAKEKPKAPAPGTKLDGLDGVELPDPDVDMPDDENAVDQLAKLSVDIRLKRAQAKRHELKFEQDKGNLVMLEVVEKVAAKVGAELKIRFQDMPRRITPRLFAMVKSGATDKEVQAALEREIDDGLDSVRNALAARDA